MTEQHTTAALYADHDSAEAAIVALRAAGVEVANISAAGKGFENEERVAGHYTIGKDVRHIGRHGGLWRLLSGLLADTGSFFIPGTGPIFVAGPAVSLIARAIDREDHSDLGPVGAGLREAGIPATDVPRYEDALRAGKFLLVVHGATAEATQARAVFDRTGAEEATTYGG